MEAPTDPGPGPVAPTIPYAELRRAEAAIDALLDELARMRRAHEDAFECVTPDRFTGGAGDDVRWHLAGQLRRCRALEARLGEDLQQVRHLLVQAMELEDRHRDALVAWHRRREAWHAHVLSQGHGPSLPAPDPLAAFRLEVAS